MDVFYVGGTAYSMCIYKYNTLSTVTAQGRGSGGAIMKLYIIV